MAQDSGLKTLGSSQEQWSFIFLNRLYADTYNTDWYDSFRKMVGIALNVWMGYLIKRISRRKVFREDFREQMETGFS